MASTIREIVKKYGKVGLGVHLCVSGASVAALYVAIRNNVGVESILYKFPTIGTRNPSSRDDDVQDKEESTRIRMAELAASTSGALALAVLCNKALFPVRAPITVVLTPPIARFLARRNIYKST